MGIVFLLPLLSGVQEKFGSDVSLPLLLIFGVPITFLFLYCADVQMTQVELRVQFPFGVYSIKWNEIRAFSEGGGNLKVVGEGKSISLPSFEFWHGATRGDAIEFLSGSLSRIGAERLPDYKALVPTLIGTRNH